MLGCPGSRLLPPVVPGAGLPLLPLGCRPPGGLLPLSPSLQPHCTAWSLLARNSLGPKPSLSPGCFHHPTCGPQGPGWPSLRHRATPPLPQRLWAGCPRCWPQGPGRYAPGRCCLILSGVPGPGSSAATPPAGRWAPTVMEFPGWGSHCFQGPRLRFPLSLASLSSWVLQTGGRISQLRSAREATEAAPSPAALGACGRLLCPHLGSWARPALPAPGCALERNWVPICSLTPPGTASSTAWDSGSPRQTLPALGPWGVSEDRGLLLRSAASSS